MAEEGKEREGKEGKEGKGKAMEEKRREGRKMYGEGGWKGNEERKKEAARHLVFLTLRVFRELRVVERGRTENAFAHRRRSSLHPRQAVREHGVQHHSHRPHVCLWAFERRMREQFGCRVVDRALGCSEEAAFAESSRKTPIT